MTEKDREFSVEGVAGVVFGLVAGVVGDGGAAVLGGEDEVDTNRAEGVGHVVSVVLVQCIGNRVSSLRDSGEVDRRSPALTCRALTVASPSGTRDSGDGRMPVPRRAALALAVVMRVWGGLGR